MLSDVPSDGRCYREDHFSLWKSIARALTDNFPMPRLIQDPDPMGLWVRSSDALPADMDRLQHDLRGHVMTMITGESVALQDRNSLDGEWRSVFVYKAALDLWKLCDVEGEPALHRVVRHVGRIKPVRTSRDESFDSR